MTTATFSYTGAAQTFTVPAGVTSLDVTVEGAEGGAGFYAPVPTTVTGGEGAVVTATITVTPGEILQVNVGGRPTDYHAGWNGGGLSTTDGSSYGGGGGGASDIRRSPYALADRLVAAGGGGGSADASGFHGGDGGLNGDPADGVAGGNRGEGGTQSAGGAGGAAAASGSAGGPGALGAGGAVTGGAGGNTRPGGGGGGYYGGGAGGSGIGTNGGGGGGSSLVPVGGSATSGGSTGHGTAEMVYTPAAGGVAAAILGHRSTALAGVVALPDWTPGVDDWPSSTPGGVARIEWGGYIRFWLLAEIGAGTPFHIGSHAADRLDAGNVMGDASTVMRDLPGTTGLWVDLTCDAVDVEIRAGSHVGAGLLSKVEAGTLVASLYDPDGDYDPFNPATPYALGGRTRLLPGVAVVAFCEIVTNPETRTWRRQMLFSGTADRWEEEWTKEPSDRTARLTATDYTKNLVKLDRDEQAPVGAGDTVFARLNRVATYFDFNPPTHYAMTGETDRTLQATTLAANAWEQLNRAVDDDLGFLWIYPTEPTAGVNGPGLIWLAREAWTDTSGGLVRVGCGDGYFDVASEAVPLAFDAQLVNTAYAARSGGTSQTAQNATSVADWGEQSINRTDLGLADDVQVAEWANDLVSLSAFPRNALERVVLHPGVWPESWDSWHHLVYLTFVLSRIRVLWHNPRFGYEVDTLVRPVGITHRLTVDDWSVEYRTVSANAASGGDTLHMGPHAFDHLDANIVLA